MSRVPCLVGLSGPALREAEREALRRDRPAGILLLRRNVRGREQLVALLDELRELYARAGERPPLFAADHEGGAVAALHPALPAPPSALAMGLAGDPALTRELYRAVGTQCRELGIQLVLAPVADLLLGPSAVVGTRSFGSDPVQVARQVASAVAGLHDAGVHACVKHWPGHGRPAADSHRARPRVDASLQELLESDLVPFVAALQAGVDAVMVGHLEVPALDPDEPFVPGSRRAVHGWLRERLGYEGLVVGDALEMAGFGDASAVATVRAGCDLLLSGRPADELAGLWQELDEGLAGDRPRVEDACRRVEPLRRELSPPTAPADTGSFDRVRQRGVVALWPESRDALPWPPRPRPASWCLLDAASGDRLLRLPGVAAESLDHQVPEQSPLWLEFQERLGPEAQRWLVAPPTELGDDWSPPPAPPGCSGWVLASLRPWPPALQRRWAEAFTGEARPGWVVLLGDPSLERALPAECGVLLVPGARPEDARVAAALLAGEIALESTGRWGL